MCNKMCDRLVDSHSLNVLRGCCLGEVILMQFTHFSGEGGGLAGLNVWRVMHFVTISSPRVGEPVEQMAAMNHVASLGIIQTMSCLHRKLKYLRKTILVSMWRQ